MEDCRKKLRISGRKVGRRKLFGWLTGNNVKLLIAVVMRAELCLLKDKRVIDENCVLVL